MSTLKFLKLNSTNFPYAHLADKRTQQWLLVASFSDMVSLVALYLLLVLYLPKWMQRRKPFQLKPLLLLYNLCMVLLNAHICKELIFNVIRLKYNLWCQPCRELYSKEELKIAAAVWWFYFSKLLEFADTIFFILRKKHEQITFLHVYHHCTMFPLWWIAIKWVPTGSTIVPSTINSFIHVIMYSYYGLSAFGPSVQKFIWWKKYLTILQLVQFVFGAFWSAQAILRGCDFPTWINFVTIGYMASLLLLFGQFYVKAYQTKKNKHY
ncbi:elongation of very long chain fatty acids protein 4-like [Anastrepha obliqua]|uniref:elongation of very long chain fatty acids protein 4-like n=1 Tax=Anastrepha obliqua TaxID=95512 RepID=UPI00240A0E04|nr:elongation of very long chain fatty acids protein 4-like [Anastrepha obliqua]